MNKKDMLIMGQYIKKMYEKLFSVLLSETGLSQVELDVLLFLYHYPERDTARDITELRCITKSHISVAVERLIERGLMERRQDTNDRRYIHLTLTSDAKSLGSRAAKIQDTFGTLLYQGFTEEELIMFDYFMDKVRENAERAFTDMNK